MSENTPYLLRAQVTGYGFSMLLDKVSMYGRRGPRTAWRAIITGIALLPIQASAHVKWFSPIADVTQSPVAPSVVLSPLFWVICGSFVSLVFAGFLVDGQVARRWPRLASSGPIHADLEEKLIRLATGAFFLLLWDKGAVVPWAHGRAILTPELVANNAWMGPLQFAIAVLVAWRSSCIFAAAGICVLYGYAIAMFGVFHMTDYVFFLGLVAYLAITSIGGSRALRLRVPLLSGALAFSLMWTAIEKFVYPQWTLYLVGEHPDLAFGFPWPFAVVVAGFVEFTLAFYFMTGRGLVRFGAAAYAAIFLAAIPEFGHLDAVGHILIVGILAVVCLRGASPLQGLLGVAARRPLANTASISAIYLMLLASFFTMYYGLHWLEYA